MNFSLRPKSVRFRLTLWYVGTLACVLAVYSFGLFYFLRQNLLDDVDRKLRVDVESTADNALGDGVEKTLEALRRDSSQNRWLAELLSSDGKLLGSVPQEESSALGEIDPACRASLGSTYFFTTADGLHLRVRCSLVKLASESVVIRIARPMERIEAEIDQFRFAVMVGFPFTVLLAMIGGYFLTRKMLQPIADMTSAAGRISAENLNERLKIENPEDEMGKLAAAFNDTFGRLDRTFSEMKRFTADASHELRTPLTVIRTVGEVALREQHSVEEYRDTISNILEESDRLRHLVESLLTLSRADAGQVAVQIENLDLVELCREVVSHLAVLAEEKQQRLQLDANGAVPARVDPKLVRQALINIVHNAIKYAGKSASIVLRVRSLGGTATIEISDNGPGIAPEHHQKLFERFYRVDSGRSRSEGGTGLGLSIARWGVESSGGRIELESEPGKGSTFRIALSGTESK